MREEKGVTLVSFARLGNEADMKSEPTYYRALETYRSGLLNRLVPIHVVDTFELPPDKVMTPMPGGRILPGMLYLFDRYVPFDIYDRRVKIIKLFDKFVAREVHDDPIVHAFPGFIKTLTRTRNAGGTTIASAPMSHPETMRALVKPEEELYGTKSLIRNQFSLHEQTYQQADHIFCLSDFSKQTYVSAGFDIKSVHNVGPLGVDIHRYAETEIPEDRFVVLTVANVSMIKGLRYLLDAWESLSLPRAELVICGAIHGPVERKLREQINELTQVTHVGQVPDPQPYYEEASLLAHPSLSEGAPRVVLEAFASGIPAVITEHSGACFVNDAAEVVPIRDPDRLASVIKSLYYDRERLNRMGKLARALVEEEYKWSDFSERVRDAHQRILKAGRNQ